MAAKKTAKCTVLNVAAMKGKDELLAALTATQAELAETRRSLAQKELTNTHRLKELRQQIARLKTRLNQEETEA